MSRTLSQFTIGFLWLLGAAPTIAETASGWYLMIPPMSKYDAEAEYLSGYQIRDDLPLSKWFQHRAYDTAEACEDSKQSLLLVEHNYYAKMSEAYLSAFRTKDDAAMMKHKRWSSETANAKVNAMISSRCVKSDDPRLAK